MPDYRTCVEEIQRQLVAMTDLEGVLDEEADLVEELGLASVEVMELIEELEETSPFRSTPWPMCAPSPTWHVNSRNWPGPLDVTTR
jgi:hypothetical protein